MPDGATRTQHMTSCGYLTINPPSYTAVMERRPMHEQRSVHEQRQQQSSSSSAVGPDAPVITDEGVESEETDSRRSAYHSSESTMSSSFSSSTSSSETRSEGRETQQPQQQLPARRRPVAIRDGEITGGSSIPSTAIVRRRPLHQTLGESTDDNFEVALSWLRNKRILLGRLVETSPHGKLSMVCFKNI